MKKALAAIIAMASIGLISCDDGSTDENVYRVSVSLQDDVTVPSGTEIELQADARVEPDIEGVKFTYLWRKVVYHKSFVEIVADHGGDEELAFESLEKSFNFSTEASITDVTPSLLAGGYVEYYVKADAYGFSFNTTDSDAPRIVRTDYDTAKVFVVD